MRRSRPMGTDLTRRLLLALALVLAPGLAAAQRTALLVPGKTSLYQRILTRPGALLQREPGGDRAGGEALPPLSVFYVYDRRTLGDTSWLEVGSSDHDGSEGWIPGKLAIDWRQTLTLGFTRTDNRDPALFFKDRDALADLLASEQVVLTTDYLRTLIREGRIPADFPVIAQEPPTYVDPNKAFYLLPILGSEPMYLDSGHRTTLLNVAAVTLQPGETQPLSPETKPEPKPAEAAPRAYRTAVVGVIDTTSSMGPYIDRTRAAIHQMYERLRASEIGGAFSFGLVAYRDNVEAAPGLGYVSRVVATLEDGRTPETFLEKVDRVAPARVSSHGFSEDAFAGIYDAIQSMDWSGYSSRYIVLITDAGARDGQDPLSKTKLSADRLRLLAQEKDQTPGGAKIAIAVLHLLTPEGRANHAAATAQYQALSRWGETGGLYFPVEGGSIESFGSQVDTLADALMKQLERARAGDFITVPDAPDTPTIVKRTAMVGRAMQLAYLGRATGSQAPRLIDAWVSDRDPVDPTLKSLEVRVLISKRQLSDLQETLQAILTAGEQTFMSAKDFFAQLRSAAATLARDPDRLTPAKVQRLADVGLVGEWLEDLPYTSQIMNLTEARWLARSYAEQQEVLDVIEEKIGVYQRIHDDSDRWVQLGPRDAPAETVTTVPLDALP